MMRLKGKRKASSRASVRRRAAFPSLGLVCGIACTLAPILGGCGASARHPTEPAPFSASSASHDLAASGESLDDQRAALAAAATEQASEESERGWPKSGTDPAESNATSEDTEGDEASRSGVAETNAGAAASDDSEMDAEIAEDSDEAADDDGEDIDISEGGADIDIDIDFGDDDDDAADDSDTDWDGGAEDEAASPRT